MGLAASFVKEACSFAKEGALELVWPTRCVSCNAPHTLLCDECQSLVKMTDPVTACKQCGAPFGYLTCTECMEEEWETSAVICAATFARPVDRMLKIYKDQGERRLSFLLAGLMFAAYANALHKTALSLYATPEVVFVPATADAFAKRGFDHMELIARDFCAMSELSLVDALVKHKTKDQRELGREERIANVAKSFEVVRNVKDRHILLLDDVVTTGATLRAAARALLGAGAARVTGLAVARVW